MGGGRAACQAAVLRRGDNRDENAARIALLEILDLMGLRLVTAKAHIAVQELLELALLAGCECADHYAAKSKKSLAETLPSVASMILHITEALGARPSKYLRTLSSLTPIF